MTKTILELCEDKPRTFSELLEVLSCPKTRLSAILCMLTKRKKLIRELVDSPLRMGRKKVWAYSLQKDD